MGVIGRYGAFYRFIDLLGHMRPPEALSRRVAGLRFASPLGMGAAIDPEGQALRAFERFGFGFIEVGPVGEGDGAPAMITAHRRTRSLHGVAPVAPVSRVVERLRRQPPRTSVRRLVRIADAGAAAGRVADAAQGVAEGFIVTLAATELDPTTVAAVRRTGRPCGVAIPLGARPALPVDVDFLVVDPPAPPASPPSPPGPEWSPGQREAGIDALRRLKQEHPGLPILYAAGGIESPREASELVAAGADLIGLTHGFVFTGPGLPKRVNTALAALGPSGEGATEGAADAVRPAEPPLLVELALYSWFWSAILGLAMSIGALLAAWFALNRVILPYDEAATGLSTAAIRAYNPRLLDFMAHDRLTLAGTMMSLGILYVGVAWGGGRRGLLWAKEAVGFSAFAGFLTFFGFIAYGYFDQFHAFVAALLLPVAVQVVVGRDAPPAAMPLDLDNDLTWRRGAVGQLFFVMEAAGLLLAGLVITFLGSGRVFVPSDLTFLGTDAATVRAFHANLVPLIAHDRATFGGMLIASGVAVGVTALWGFERGARWLFITLAVGGFPAYLATLAIHAHIGYTDHLHLSPVFVGVAFHLLGLLLSRRFLTEESQQQSGS